MTAGGWLFLAVSWGLILGLCLFCCLKLFQPKRR